MFVFNNTNEENPWSRISAAINVNRVTNFDNQTSLCQLCRELTKVADPDGVDRIRPYFDLLEFTPNLFLYFGIEVNKNGIMVNNF